LLHRVLDSRPESYQRLQTRKLVDPHTKINHEQVWICGEIDGLAIELCSMVHLRSRP
jgi:hypothetical protein